MQRLLFVIVNIAFLICSSHVQAQFNQTVTNGANTKSEAFKGAGCTYTWINSNPDIGLAANGTGNIPSFTAVNNGTTPVTATITVLPATSGYAYSVNGRDGTISVINTNTNAVETTIDEGTGPNDVTNSLNATTINSDGTRLYVANYSNNNASSFSVINTITNKVIATNNVVLASFGLALSQDDSRLYVASTGPLHQGVLYIYNTADNTLISQINLNFNPYYLAMSPDGSRLYLGDNYFSIINVMNTATNAIVASINFVQEPTGIALTPDGSYLYACNENLNTVTVINTATNSIVATIPVGINPEGISMSPDGSRAYVANPGSSDVSVIDIATNKVIADVAVTSPYGISISPDGSKIYTAGGNANSVTVISTSTYNILTTIPVGLGSDSFGNFVTAGIGCSSKAVSFTITVNPTPQPVINVTNVTGIISACQGTASISPAIQQFNVSGSGLSANITVTAPTGFELSADNSSGYGASLTLTETGGTVNTATIFVRSSASALAGGIQGNVVLTSAGAASQNVPVNAIINENPIVNAVTSQSLTNGAPTMPVNFTGNASAFNWVNNTPGIGLAPSGTGDIASFNVINSTGLPIVATITVTPINGAGCKGIPVVFTITAKPTPPPALTASGTLASLTTIYGTPSHSETFSVTGTNITSDILITPPAGFELSAGGVGFTPTVKLSATGNISSLLIYIRLAAITPVGDYKGNIVLSTPDGASANLAMPDCTVTPAPLTIIADNKTKPSGAVNPALTVSFNGFVNNDSISDLIKQPYLSTTATTVSTPGQYPITASDALSINYSITYIPGALTIQPPSSLSSIPNTFTPNGDGMNDTWNIKYLEYYPNCTINIFDRWGQKLFSSVGYTSPWDGRYNGSLLPSGTYYYIINPKNGQGVISGWVALIR